MTLFLSLILFTANAKATARIPVVTLAGVNQPPSTITATYSQSATLDPNADNAPTINAFLDSLPEGVTVNLPPGVWPVHSAVKIKKHGTTLETTGNGQRATLKLIASNTTATVLEIGDYHQSVRVNNVTLKRIILEVAGANDTGTYTCLNGYGEDFNAEDVEFVGSPNEGAVLAGKRATLERCIARRCGIGNLSYSLPLSGFNVHCWPTIYKYCDAIGCGFGWEIDGHGSKCLYCRCIATADAPNMGGFAIGSASFGVNNVELGFCETVGTGGGFGFSNGNGTLTNIWIHDSTFDGDSSFTGGKFTNLASDPYYPSGPPVGNSRIERCTFHVRKQHQGVLGANTGPAPGTWDHDNNPETPPYHELGRENVTISHCRFIFYVQVNDSPSLYVAGNYSGTLVYEFCEFDGQNEAPSRGDIACFSNSANTMIQGQPNLTLNGNTARRADGSLRPLVVKYEGVVQ